MSTTTLLDAIADVDALLTEREPNTAALNWGPVDDAVRRALETPTPADVLRDTVLLRAASGEAPVSLMDVVFRTAPRPGHNRTCDVLAVELTDDDVHVLWIPAGRSAVQLSMCGLARETLEDLVGPLVWERN